MDSPTSSFFKTFENDSPASSTTTDSGIVESNDTSQDTFPIQIKSWPSDIANLFSKNFAHKNLPCEIVCTESEITKKEFFEWGQIEENKLFKFFDFDKQKLYLVEMPTKEHEMLRGTIELCLASKHNHLVYLGSSDVYYSHDEFAQGDASYSLRKNQFQQLDAIGSICPVLIIEVLVSETLNHVVDKFKAKYFLLDGCRVGKNFESF